MISLPKVSQIKLRPMTLADLNQVEAIEQTSFPTPWPRGAFIDDLKRERRSICWVAEWDRAGKSPLLVGSIVIWISSDLAHIGTLAVRPGCRKQGVGQYLLANTLLECVRRGVKKAMLEVRASNQPAQNLYRKFGFDEVGYKHDYYKDTQEDAVLMLLSPLEPDKLVELAEPG